MFLGCLSAVLNLGKKKGFLKTNMDGLQHILIKLSMLWNFHTELTVIWLFLKIFKLIFVFFQAVYEGQAYPMLMSVHLSIVSRMILSYKPEFQEFLNALATNNGNHSDDIAAQILDVWMDKMPCVTQPERRKLLSLGTSHILRYHF